jgi:hypothetical protein
VVWILWLGFEDRGPVAVFVLGGLICLAVALRFASPAIRPPLDPSRRRAALAGWGAVAGAAVPITAALLMLVKVGLHGHPEPDFQAADVAAALARTPVWVVAGGLVGLAFGLVQGGSQESAGR